MALKKGSTVAVSTLGVKKEKDFFLQGYHEMLRRIEPKAIICYGKPFPEMKGNLIEVDYAKTNNLSYQKTFYGFVDINRCQSLQIQAVPKTQNAKGFYIRKTGGYLVAQGYGGGGGRSRMGRNNGKTPRDNQKQNEQSEAVAKKLGLTKKQQQELHREISHQGFNFQELLEFAREWFGIYD